jgi:transcriptional antiterminator NusG
VQTGKEEMVCKYLNNVFGDDEANSFFPKIKMIYKNSKQIRQEFKPMFPGYVFVETKKDGRNFASLTTQIAEASTHIIRLLGKENLDHMTIHENEKDFILGLCDNKYIVNESVGFIEGDTVVVTSGPLRGRESIVKRINRHKKRAELEFYFLGDVRRVSISLEIVEKR